MGALEYLDARDLTTETQRHGDTQRHRTVASAKAQRHEAGAKSLHGPTADHADQRRFNLVSFELYHIDPLT